MKVNSINFKGIKIRSGYDCAQLGRIGEQPYTNQIIQDSFKKMDEELGADCDLYISAKSYGHPTLLGDESGFATIISLEADESGRAIYSYADNKDDYQDSPKHLQYVMDKFVDACIRCKNWSRDNNYEGRLSQILDKYMAGKNENK